MKAKRLIFFISLLLPLSLIISTLPQVKTPVLAATPVELFFSEYIEGSSNNKALEIYNSTRPTIYLPDYGYDIQMYFDGSLNPGLTIPLTGAVANNDVYVLAHAGADAAILAQADQTNDAAWFSGNDAVVLRKNGVVIDVIGQIGFDPGAQWGSGLASTQDNTLRRKLSIYQGDTNAADTFDPAIEWEGFPTNTYDGLGIHPKFLINEVDAEQDGPDTAEFIEIYIEPYAGTPAWTYLHGLVVVLYSGVDDKSYRTFDLMHNQAVEHFVICGNAHVVRGCAMQVGPDFLQDGPAAVAIYAAKASDFPDGTPVTTTNLLDAFVYDTDDPDDPGLLALLNPGQPQVNENETGLKNDSSSQRCPEGSGGARNTSTFKQFLPTNDNLNICQTEIGDCRDPAYRIHTIQGNGPNSPMAGLQAVVEAVAVGNFQDTATGLSGFFLQEEDAQVDADPTTSEGIFVFDDGFGVGLSHLGRVVRVLGEVSEYYGLTELANISAVKVCWYDEIASPAMVSLPVAGLTDWEHWEGMLVTFSQTLYATGNDNLGRNGEVELSINSRLFAPTQIAAPGSPAIQMLDLNNRSRIQLDDGSNVQYPLPLPPYIGTDNTLRLGDSVSGLTGVLGYSSGSYEIHPTLPVSFIRVNPRPVPAAVLSGTLKIVSANLLNYFTTLDTGANICGPSGKLACRGANTAEEFDRQRTKIIYAFLSMDPDIAGLLEVENNSTTAIQNLVDGLNKIFGAGTYAYIDTGIIGTDAVKVALIYNPAKVTPVGAFKILDSSVDPNFLDTKNSPSLVQTFQTPAGAKFNLAVNHFKSKDSDCNDVGDPDTGDGQGNCNLTRTKAANALVNWLATDPTGSGDSDFLIIGGLNSYGEEGPITTIRNAGYVDLIKTWEGSPDYSYAYRGQTGTLDYAFASPSLASQIGSAYDFHVNADEPSALDYNDYNQPGLYTPYIYRFADHDPIAITISPWDVKQVGNELRIGYGQGNTAPQYAVLHLNDSYFRMNYGPPSGWGTSLVLLPAFWSGGTYYQGAPVSAAHQLVSDNLVLDINGNIHGLQVHLTVTLWPPMPNLLTAQVEAIAVGSVPIDTRPGEAFKPVFLSSMHISDTQWDAKAAVVDGKPRSIPAQGWLIQPTPAVGTTSFGFLGGSSAWKVNAPTLQIEINGPLQTAGWVTASSDPNDDNIGLWAASNQLLTDWRYSVSATNVTQLASIFLPVIVRSGE